MAGEQNVHSIAEEVGQVIHGLQRCREDLARLQAAVSGFDARLHLIAEASLPQLLRGAGARAGAVSANGLPAWLHELWQEIVVQINAQLLAVPDHPEGSASAPSAGIPPTVVGPLQALARLTETLDPEFGSLQGEGDIELQPILDRYTASREQLARLVRKANELELPARVALPWAGRLEPQRPEAAACLRTPAGGGPPQVDLRPLLECLENDANRQIAAAHARLGGAPDAEESTIHLEEDLQALLERLLDLKHGLAALGWERRQQDRPLPAAATRIIPVLSAALRNAGLEEMEIAPGDRVNGRVHRVVARENDGRYEPGCIIRVLVPGYKFRGNLARMAEVVATPQAS